MHAALNLLDTLETEHEVHILPLRDPFGFVGVNHCLAFAAGEPIEIQSHRAALDYLLMHGRLIWSEEMMHIFTLGDLGFVAGTTARLGGQRKVMTSPPALAEKLVSISDQNQIAILFGPEDRGGEQNLAALWSYSETIHSIRS